MPKPRVPKYKPRRGRFRHAIAIDAYLDWLRRDTRATTLGEIDWLLHRHPACPWRKNSNARQAYEKGFARERAINPTPDYPPIPDLPRARTRFAFPHDEKEA